MNQIDRHNEYYAHKWNIPELPTSDKRVLDYIRNIKLYIEYLKETLFTIAIESRFQEKNVELFKGIKLLILTNHEIIEIGKDNFSKRYEGMNKPKGIIDKYFSTTKDIDIKTYLRNGERRLDNDYRASYRLLILKLRNANNKLRSWNEVKKLLLHELAHTMANHLMFYEEDNHMGDFITFHNFLINVDKTLKK